MAQIKIVDPAQATGKSKELLTALQNNIKSVPNLAKALANSPAALKAWMEFDGAVDKGSLNAKLRQEIALAVGRKRSRLRGIECVNSALACSIPQQASHSGNRAFSEHRWIARRCLYSTCRFTLIPD